MVKQIIKKGKNGYSYRIYQEVQRTLPAKQGKIKRDITNRYTEAKQLNIIRDAILKIGKTLGIQLPELEQMDKELDLIFQKHSGKKVVPNYIKENIEELKKEPFELQEEDFKIKARMSKKFNKSTEVKEEKEEKEIKEPAKEIKKPARKRGRPKKSQNSSKKDNK